VPSEFLYWERIDHPRVRAIRALARALLGFDLAPPDAVVRDLAAMYFDADPPCEAFVDEVYLRLGRAHGRGMLEQALESGVDAVADPPPSLRALFADLDDEPAWLDWDTVERGARAFRRYGPAVFRFAGAITLEGYAESSVAKPLAFTGAYAGATTRRRFLETVAFWIAVSEPGALRRGAPGRASALRVRVMHVFVRRKLLAHPAWNVDAWGVPISQGDALLTLMGGSFAPGVAMHALGYLPSRNDIVAMMHFWRYVGHLLGVRPRWYPSSLAEAAQLAFVTSIKGARCAGDDGRALCQAYANAFAPDRDVPLARRLRDELEHGIHLGYTKLFTSRKTYKANALPPAGAWVLAPLLGAPFVAASELLRRTIPALERVVDRAARARRARWFARHMGDRVAEYQPVDELRR
jgi:hypothetical protein